MPAAPPVPVVPAAPGPAAPPVPPPDPSGSAHPAIAINAPATIDSLRISIFAIASRGECGATSEIDRKIDPGMSRSWDRFPLIVSALPPH